MNSNEIEKQSSNSNLILNLEGFDGPIDLLLQLAREQKVDLVNISILALAEQYISYIENLKVRFIY